MKITQIVFSPTGGTQKVVTILTENLSNYVNKIDLTETNIDYSTIHFEKDDIAIIAVPSYGGRVPTLAAERIAKIQGNQTQCIIVCVYGNRAYEDTLIELNDIAEKCNFKVIAAVSSIAEHSIIHQYAAGRPDQQDKDELHSFSKKILEKINHASYTSPLQIPGQHPYKKAAEISLVPKADKNCINCGLCAKNCTAQAINKNDVKKVDSKKCISCMRCVVQCPHAARKVNTLMVSAAALVIKKACSERKSNELYI